MDEIEPRFEAWPNVNHDSLEDYEAYFDRCGETKLRLEATPIYLYQKSALQHIPELASQPKVLFILREPAQRAHSQFRFNKHRLGNIGKHVRYEAYLEQMKGLAGDPVERGHYVRYIQLWVERMGKDNVYVVQSELLFSDKVQQMKNLCDFLGIEPAFYDDFDWMKRNETRKMRSTKLHRFGQKVQPMIPSGLQEKLLLPLYLKLNSSAMPPISTADKERIESMKSIFSESNQQLAAAFPTVDLALWK